VLARIVPGWAAVRHRVDGAQAATFAQAHLFDRLVDVLQRAATNAPLVLSSRTSVGHITTQAFLLYLVRAAREAKPS
jgi:hypothetical protein